MGYFDALADAVFKTDDGGRPLFYPWGFFGKGYILPSEEKKLEIRKFVKLFHIVMLSLFVVVLTVASIIREQWAYPIAPIIAVGVGLYTWWLVSVRRLTKGFQTTKTRLTLRESYGNMARSMSITLLRLLQILALFFIIAGIFCFFMGLTTYDPPRSIACALAGVSFIGLGIAGSMVFGYMVRLKDKN